MLVARIGASQERFTPHPGATMHPLWHNYGFGSSDALWLGQIMLRLVLAAVLGGVIGLEREFKHKAAGLRTNMLICFGAALFTVLSDELARRYGGDPTRIASQIIPGIGFIGAGSILHARGSITGVTTAATLFVVASIGMASGGGLYSPAIFATGILLIALVVPGAVEEKFNLKAAVMSYMVTGSDAEELLTAVNKVLQERGKTMQSVQLGRLDKDFRMTFSVEGTDTEHDNLFARLGTLSAVRNVERFHADEEA